MGHLRLHHSVGDLGAGQHRVSRDDLVGVLLLDLGDQKSAYKAPERYDSN